MGVVGRRRPRSGGTACAFLVVVVASIPGALASQTVPAEPVELLPPVASHAEISGAVGFAGRFFGMSDDSVDVFPPLMTSNGGLAWSFDFRWFDLTGHGLLVRGGGVEAGENDARWDYDLYFIEPSYAFRFGPDRGMGFHLVGQLSVGLSLLLADMSWNPADCFSNCEVREPPIDPSAYSHLGMGGVIQATGDLRWGAFLVGAYAAVRITGSVEEGQVAYDLLVDGGLRIGIAWDLPLDPLEPVTGEPDPASSGGDDEAERPHDPFDW